MVEPEDEKAPEVSRRRLALWVEKSMLASDVYPKTTTPPWLKSGLATCFFGLCVAEDTVPDVTLGFAAGVVPDVAIWVGSVAAAVPCSDPVAAVVVAEAVSAAGGNGVSGSSPSITGALKL